MALTTNHVNNELIKFKKNVAYAFLRNGRFDPFTGSGPTAIIQRVADLAADGKQINVPLVDQLAGSGVATGTLVGNEEAVDNYGLPMWAAWARHAVAFDKNSKKESAINIRDTATPLLQGWTRRIRRDDMIDAFLSIPTATIQSGRNAGAGNRVNGIKWSAATPTEKNNWLTANADRVVFGSQKSNLVAGNVASSLLNVDETNDKMSTAVGSLLKRTAMATTFPQITPYTADEDQEVFVCFMGSRAFRDLKADPAMAQANRDARSRESGDVVKGGNPIFTGSSTLVHDGIVYKEIPEFDARLLLAAAGADPDGAGALPAVDVAPVLLCGTSALAYVIGQMPKPTRRDETDYGFLEGIGIEMQYGVGKVAKAPVGGGSLKDWGMVTGFVAAKPDA